MANAVNDKTKLSRLTFLREAGSITGSEHLVTTPESRILPDCGLFQGLKDLRARNWATCRSHEAVRGCRSAM